MINILRMIRKKTRSILWPIKKRELKLFIPMLLIYALIVFNYSLLRAAKDALIITAPASSAAAIPFIKVWAMLPMAFLLTFIFTRLSNWLKREHLFYAVLSIFLAFFALFALVLYPMRESLHPHDLADKLQNMLPVGFQGLISIFRNWTFTLFYVLSELWGTTVMTVLFWGFANEITSVQDAKRFYAILGVGANLATILSGKVTVFLSGHATYLQGFLPHDRWGQSIIAITLLVIVGGIVTMGLFRFLYSQLQIQHPKEFSGTQRSKVKMGLRKNFAYLAKSKYLIYIAIIVLTYNVALNMVEIVWKDQVHQLFHNPNDYHAYMGQIQVAMGVLSTIMALFVCGPVMRKFRWSTAAMVTPVILLTTGVLFFLFVFLSRSMGLQSIAILSYAMTPLSLCVFFGSAQNCLTRACKYTLFDGTKELSFIPLSEESQLKGKAAIDGIGSRIGKSGGSLLHQLLLMGFGTVALSTPYVAVFLLVIVGVWLYAAKALGKDFELLTKQEVKVEIKAADQDAPLPTS